MGEAILNLLYIDVPDNKTSRASKSHLIPAANFLFKARHVCPARKKLTRIGIRKHNTTQQKSA